MIASGRLEGTVLEVRDAAAITGTDVGDVRGDVVAVLRHAGGWWMSRAGDQRVAVRGRELSETEIADIRDLDVATIGDVKITVRVWSGCQ